MHLYIARHGLAVPKDEDPNCPLSENGRRDVQRMASFLARTRPAIKSVMHSGKVRAAQTALIYSEAIGRGRIVEESPLGLKPNDSADPIVTAIDGWTDDIMLVSHLPLVGKLASRLVTGTEDTTVLHFLPGTLACLARGGNGDGWTLAWCMSPDQLGG